MKLNKRKCRKFADPDLKFSQDRGILHAPQIEFIVCTAIKIIDHHRTLILYVYPRKQLAKGNFKSYYTVFQTKDDYITLSRREDGSTTWRKSAFDNLDSSYRFSDVCAFYSAKDESSVSHYFNCTDTGFEPLIKAQDAILAHRRKQRQIAKEQAVAARMAGIPALPRGLESWIKSIMPAYFFYNYKRRAKTASGVCSACEHEITLPDIKQGNKTTCPHCKHSIIAKPRSRRGSNMYDRETFEIIQNMGDGRLVIRIIKAYFSYTADIPKIDIYENIRQFISLDTNGEFCAEHYYYAHNSGVITNWKKGIRPEYIMYQHQFEGDTCGHLYTHNLPDALANTHWQYCSIADFYNHFHERMQALPFLREYLNHPRLEHLCKVGFYNLVSDLVYKNTASCLDETQNRTHKILGVAAEDVDFLRNLNADMSILKTFQQYDNIKDRQQLLAWQLKHNVNRDILKILYHMTVHKFIQYMDKQYDFLRLRKTPQKTQRYNSMQDLLSEFRDYLDMCQKLGYDLKNSFVLYPRDLQKSHDRVARRLKHKADAKTKREFIAVYKSIAGQMDFEQNGMKIVYPSTPDDVIKEGHFLHHCVENYIDRVAAQECIILFLRQCSELSKSYYTIEIREQEVVQVRGIGNCTATPEVRKFISSFKQQVLKASVNRAA